MRFQNARSLAVPVLLPLNGRSTLYSEEKFKLLYEVYINLGLSKELVAAILVLAIRPRYVPYTFLL